uniref:Uncharacterized protein n=1 Tax=Arundo donax TaxID=35708 RepID=A0A0A9E8I8_ARUDO
MLNWRNPQPFLSGPTARAPLFFFLLTASCDEGASSPWRSRPLRRRATVLSLAGVEAEAEADGAAPPLSDGEPPPPLVDAEWAAPPEGRAPGTIAAGIARNWGGGGRREKP